MNIDHVIDSILEVPKIDIPKDLTDPRMQYMLQHPNHSHSMTRLTPLMVAAKVGHANLAEELINSGADVNCQIWVDDGGISGELKDDWDDVGFHALMYAAKNGNYEIVRILCENNADPDLADDDGDVALNVTSDPEIIQYLLEHGASVDYANYDGETPLLYALSNSPLESVKILLQHGASMDPISNSGGVIDYALSFKWWSQDYEYRRAEVTDRILFLLNHGVSFDYFVESFHAHAYNHREHSNKFLIPLIESHALKAQFRNQDPNTDPSLGL